MKLSGLTYDAERRLAHFDVKVPLAGGNCKYRRYKRFRDTVPVLDKADAEAKFLIYRDNRKNGKNPDPTQAELTFAEFIEQQWDFIAFGGDKQMKPNTAKNYLCNINARLLPVFGKLRLSEIDRNRIADFRMNMTKATTLGESKHPYSPSTINDTMKLLHSLLNKAVDRELLAKVPKFPENLKVKRLRLELSEEEERGFLASFDNREGFLAEYDSKRINQAEVEFEWFKKSKPLFVLASMVGLRRSDLLGLKWSSVDLKNGVIDLSTAKTDTPVFIKLSPTALAALQECRNRRLSSTVWVFTQKDGDRFSLTTLRRHFAKAKRLSGLNRRFRFHDLRHTAASHLVSAGVPLAMIAQVLGHSSVVMTQRYAKPSTQAMMQVGEAMERK